MSRVRGLFDFGDFILLVREHKQTHDTDCRISISNNLSVGPCQNNKQTKNEIQWLKSIIAFNNC